MFQNWLRHPNLQHDKCREDPTPPARAASPPDRDHTSVFPSNQRSPLTFPHERHAKLPCSENFFPRVRRCIPIEPQSCARLLPVPFVHLGVWSFRRRLSVVADRAACKSHLSRHRKRNPSKL